MDYFAALAMTWIQFRVLAARCARSFASRFALLNLEGAGKTGCTLYPRSRVQLRTENAHTSIQVQRKHSGLPCAVALLPSPARGVPLANLTHGKSQASQGPAHRQKRLDKNVNGPNRIVAIHVVFDTCRKKARLVPVNTGLEGMIRHQSNRTLVCPAGRDSCPVSKRNPSIIARRGDGFRCALPILRTVHL
jgi:hypothetical protein